MKLKIRGGMPLKGVIDIPADKSLTHRGLMFGALGDRSLTVKALGAGEDNHSTAEVLRGLGVQIEAIEGGYIVNGVGLSGLQDAKGPLDCGNSGTTIRLMCGILAGAGVSASLVGDESLSKRPMSRVTVPLRKLGGNVQGVESDGKERTPLDVAPSALQGGDWVSPIASAQVKSCLLLAGLLSGARVRVTEAHCSRDHTERLLSGLGVAVTSTDDADGHHVEIAAQELSALQWPTDTFVVPGDVSSAAFWLVAASLIEGSEVELKGVGINPSRDGIVEVLEAAGVHIERSATRDMAGEPVVDLKVKAPGRSELKPVVISGAQIPRLIDELVVLGVFGALGGGLEVRNAEDLKAKESDRIAETLRILEGFGLHGDARDDGYLVDGGQLPKPADMLDVSTDHRVAMTGAVLAMACAVDAESSIDGFDVASVSYPEFLRHSETLGARIEIVDG